MYLLADVEANGLTPDKIHCISVKEYPDGEVMRFTNMEFFKEWVKYHQHKIFRWFFHNGLAYDVKVINSLVEEDLIEVNKVVDTMVCSKLYDYQKFNTHSLKELGQYLGVYKGDYDGGWEEYSEEMGDYCDQDVEVLHAIVDYLWGMITDPNWSESLRLEHQIALVCQDMHDNGFSFDKEEAEHLLSEIKQEMNELEESFKEAFGSKLVEDKRIKYRKKKDGTLFSNVQDAIDTYPKTEVVDDMLICYDYEEFNPGSPKQRIDVLWEAGWKPIEKTKGHIKAEKESRKYVHR